MSEYINVLFATVNMKLAVRFNGRHRKRLKTRVPQPHPCTSIPKQARRPKASLSSSSSLYISLISNPSHKHHNRLNLNQIAHNNRFTSLRQKSILANLSCHPNSRLTSLNLISLRQLTNRSLTNPHPKFVVLMTRRHHTSSLGSNNTNLTHLSHSRVRCSKAILEP